MSVFTPIADRLFFVDSGMTGRDYADNDQALS